MKTQLHAPLLGLGIFFAAGIVLAGSYNFSSWIILLPPLLLFLLLFYFDRKLLHPLYERGIAVLIAYLFVSLGYAFSDFQEKGEEGNLVGAYQCSNRWYYGSLKYDVKPTPYGSQGLLELEAIYQDTSWKAIGGEIQLYTRELKDTLYRKGQKICFQAFVKPIFASGTDYHRYLLGRGIEHLAYAKQLSILEEEKGFLSFFDLRRRKMCQQIDSLFADPRMASLAKAMFLGEKSDLDKEQKASFAGAGLSHMLAISGLHVGIVFICLNLLFLPLNLILYGRKIRDALILCALILYMFLCGAGPAVARAVCMFACVLLFRISNKRYSLFNVLAISAWLQMLAYPQVIFEIGFQLSYTAVFALIFFMPLYQKFVQSPFPLLNTLNSWLGVSLIASLATLPLCLWYFEQFPVYFLIANILASTISFALVFSGFIFILFLEIAVVAEALADICGFFLWLLTLIAEEIAKLPHAVLTHFSLDESGLWILLLELLCMALFMGLARLSNIQRPSFFIS